MNYKFYLFIAVVLIIIGYLLGVNNKQEVVDGLIQTVMTCNARKL